MDGETHERGSEDSRKGRGRGGTTPERTGEVERRRAGREEELPCQWMTSLAEISDSHRPPYLAL